MTGAIVSYASCLALPSSGGAGMANPAIQPTIAGAVRQRVRRMQSAVLPAEMAGVIAGYDGCLDRRW
jgi:hypothetical protein